MQISPEEAATLKCLKDSYFDATRKGGLIDFTRMVRGEKNDFSGKYLVKQTDLDTLFSKSVWTVVDTGGGHREVRHKLTGATVEYSNHKKEIKAGAVVTIFNEVQRHLNILNNQIYSYTNCNWKEEPDYSAARKNWLALEQSKGG